METRKEVHAWSPLRPWAASSGTSTRRRSCGARLLVYSAGFIGLASMFCGCFRKVLYGVFKDSYPEAPNRPKGQYNMVFGPKSLDICVLRAIGLATGPYEAAGVLDEPFGCTRLLC